MNNIDIFLESVKNLQTVGTLAFSSKHLVKKMVEPIRFAEARCIIELGTGNGCITRALLRRMKPDTQLLSFEINDNFHRMTAAQLHDPRLRLINDSAENMLPYIYESGFLYADYIIFDHIAQKDRADLWQKECQSQFYAAQFSACFYICLQAQFK
jgi:phospholipid N-methyltransferase